MQLPPRPPDEDRRLARLHALRVLDTQAEPLYDDIVALAAHICGTPIAAISLVDADRQWFKARVGLEARETPRDVSFCAHALGGRDLFEVPDAAADERFLDNPLVSNAPRIRFYAGAPLLDPGGDALGTLCVIDTVPRALSVSQRQALSALSRQVTALLQLRRQTQSLQSAESRLTLLRQLDQAVAESADVHAGLRSAARLLCHELGWSLAGAFAPDRRGALHSLGPFYAAELRYEPLAQSCAQLRPAITHGAAGPAWASGALVWLRDIARTHRFAHFPRIAASGLHTAVGLPIGQGDDRLGVIELLHTADVLADDDTDKLLTEAGLALGSALYRRRAEDARNASEVRLRSVAESSPDAIVIADSEGRIEAWNPAAAAMFGYPAEEAIGQPVTLIMPERFAEAHVRGLLRVLSTGETQLTGRTLELVGRRKSGEEFPVEMTLATWMSKSERMFSSILRDCSERKRNEEQLAAQAEELRTMALRDRLTGLLNRHGFVHLAEQQLKLCSRQRRPVCLLFADVNGMKPVNDQYGHDEGDLLLQDAGKVLKGCLRDVDAVARWGGDEFVALLVDTEAEGASRAVARLEEHVRTHNAAGGRRYELSMSIGLAELPAGAAYTPTLLDELVARADLSMYEQKRARGRRASPTVHGPTV